MESYALQPLARSIKRQLRQTHGISQAFPSEPKECYVILINPRTTALLLHKGDDAQKSNLSHIKGAIYWKVDAVHSWGLFHTISL